MLHIADLLRVFHAHRGDAIVVPGRGGRHWAKISARPGRDLPMGDPAMGGHAGFALGLALARSKEKVVLFDSEGDLLMNLGILPTVAELAPANFYHFMLDNECYATTGGQPVPNAKNVAYDVVARGCGYPRAFAFDELAEFEAKVAGILGNPGPSSSRSRWCPRSRTCRSASGRAGRRARATRCWPTSARNSASSRLRKNAQAAQKGPDARRRPTAAREAYSCTLSVRPRAPTKQMGLFPQPARLRALRPSGIARPRRARRSPCRRGRGRPGRCTRRCSRRA